ncbi:hypothetical protein [Colwellia piezophila]|uniref:hypothetical protein n=1 Tax=Colwellia piezophila TaxID=211668 RepID=UPI0003665D72|nr:hypothetical protein [Colwellia piezophila]
MRILLCLVFLSTSCFAGVDLNVFSQNLSLPESCSLQVENHALITIKCKDTQHHLTFSSVKDGEFSANSFLKKAKSENVWEIELIDHKFETIGSYKHFFTHTKENGKDDFTYVLCDKIMCFYVDSYSREFIDEVLSQLEITPIWKS